MGSMFIADGDRELKDRIVALAGSIHAAEAELVGLLAELGDRWQGTGFRSLEHWLSVRAGFTLSEGRVRAALAGRCSELPVLVGALGDGRLSVGAARAAARVATADNEADVVEVATVTTAQQAARVFSSWQQAEEAGRERSRPPGDLDPDAVGEADPGDERGPATWFSTRWDEQGHLLVSGRLDPTCGALLRSGLDAARALLGGATAAVSNVAALAELAGSCSEAANRAGRRTRNGERFAVHVTIEATVLAGIVPGAGVLDDGHRIDTAVVRTWLEQATAEGIITNHGEPLWLGRSKRLPTRAIRRALHTRDRGCAYPGCDQTRWLHPHHAPGWTQGGTTDIDKQVQLCTRHHRLLHKGEYNVDLIDGRPRFTTLDGTEITGKRPPPEVESLPPPRNEHPSRRGEQLTYYALDALVTRLLTAAA